MESLSPCLCGSADVTIGPGLHRLAARESCAQQLENVTRRDRHRGDVQRQVNQLQLAQQVLEPDHLDVSCASCGRWVHGDTADVAAARWNKAIAKLSVLQDCCKTDYERRVDYDGMVLHVCTSPAHDDSVHGRRYFPLEPDEGYAPKPSDAGA